MKLERESNFLSELVSGSNAYFIDIIDETMNPDQGFIDAETAGYLEPRLRLPGGYLITGDIGMLVDAHSVLPILEVFCGSNTISVLSQYASGSEIYSWVIKPGLKPWTCRASINPNVADSGTYKHRDIRGFAIKAIELSAAAREACTMTLTCQAALGMIENRESSVTFPTVRPFSFTDGSVTKLDGDSLSIEAVTFRAERIIADDNFVLGSRFLPYLHAAGVSLSGSFDLGFRDWDTVKKFLGSASAVQPATSPSTYTLELKFEGDDMLSQTDPYTLRIYAPKITLDTTNINIDRRERIIQSVNFTGIYDTSSGYAVEFRVRGTKTDGEIWVAG